MKWFNKWFTKKVRWALNQPEERDDAPDSPVAYNTIKPRHGQVISSSHTRSPDTQGIHFIMYPAVGGNVVEIRHYNRKTDDTEVSLHLIHTDSDIGESIGKIITFEMLKR